VTEFDKTINTLLEIHCWKGYRKVGTKMKSGKRVNDCRPINEGRYKISSNFTELPEIPPYGFWITKNGKFVVIGRMFGHDESLNELFPEIVKGKIGLDALQTAMKAGMIRVVKSGNEYSLTYHPMWTTATAKKTAKDIASFYNMGINDEFAHWDEEPEAEPTVTESSYRVTGQIIFKNPYGTGLLYSPVDSVENATTAAQAVLFAARKIGKKRNFVNSYYIPDRGYKVEQLPKPPPAPARLPYADT